MGSNQEVQENEELIKFLRSELQIARSQCHIENMAGNIVKEALWRGEWVAYRKLISFLHNINGDDTFKELLMEV